MPMKSLIGSFITLATLSLLAGCGGGGINSSVSRETSREAVRDALGSGNAARNARQAQGLRTLTSDDNGFIRYNVGDPIEVSSDLFGRVTAFSTFVFDGVERIGRFDYDIFADREYTRLAGTSKFTLIESETDFSTDAETVFNDLAPSPSASRSKYSLDKTTGSTVFEFSRSGPVLDDPAGTFFSEVSTRFTSDGAAGTGTYAFSEKRNGQLKAQSSGRYLADGSFELTWLNGRGYTVTMTFRADGAGTVNVTNPIDRLCPVSGSFNEEGIGTVTFADGTTAAFNLFDEQFWQ